MKCKVKDPRYVHAKPKGFKNFFSGLTFSSADEVAVAVVWAGVHLVRGGHVILGFGGLVEDFVAEAALDFRRFASVL